MKIYRQGVVQSGTYQGYAIKLADDSAGESAGYYVLLMQDNADGYNESFANQELLDAHLAQYEVIWSV